MPFKSMLHHSKFENKQATVLGQDVSGMFYKTDYPDTYCPGFTLPPNWDNVMERGGQGSATNTWYPHRNRNDGSTDYLQQINYMKKGPVARDNAWISKYLSMESQDRRVIVAWGRVYDVSAYYLETNIQNNGTGFKHPGQRRRFAQRLTLCFFMDKTV